MKSYVLIHERRSGMLTHEAVDDNAAPFRRRLDLENIVATGTEVVVLQANDLAELRKTHGRYFSSVDDITRELAEVLN